MLRRSHQMVGKSSDEELQSVAFSHLPSLFSLFSLCLFLIHGSQPLSMDWISLLTVVCNRLN